MLYTGGTSTTTTCKTGRMTRAGAARIAVFNQCGLGSGSKVIPVAPPPPFWRFRSLWFQLDFAPNRLLVPRIGSAALRLSFEVTYDFGLQSPHFPNAGRRCSGPGASRLQPQNTELELRPRARLSRFGLAFSSCCCNIGLLLQYWLVCAAVATSQVDLRAARDLVGHFTRVGTPITTGGGELAHTM